MLIERVLIANRGEIAIRVATTLRLLGIEAIGVDAGDEGAAPHLGAMDRVTSLPGEGGARSLLDIDAVVNAARRAGVDAVHPGYGLLAESPDAASSFEAAGIGWIGPPPEVIARLGDKAVAKEVAFEAGAPVIPGIEEPAGGDGDAADRLSAGDVDAFAAAHGYPVLVKAAAGGGGKGMRRLDAADGTADALAAARREAKASFGSDRLLLERLVEPARHVEVQVAGDHEGNVVALGERECSLQRRYQKLIEESPSPAVTPERRRRLQDAAVSVAAAAGYRNLGTVEMLLDAADPDRFYFLEVNARLQVEHPVTELVTGLDLVAMQIAIARGEGVEAFLDGESTSARELIEATGYAWPAARARARGEPRPPIPLPDRHAIEARLLAERPEEDFLPATGTVGHYTEPADGRFQPLRIPRGLRIDSGIASGSEVTTGFDPLLAKLIAVAPDRAGAMRRLGEGLADLRALGVETNGAFLIRLLGSEAVRRGDYSLSEVGRFQGSDEDGEAFGAAAELSLEAAATVLAIREMVPAAAGATGFDRADAWRHGRARGRARWELVDASGTAHEVWLRPEGSRIAGAPGAVEAFELELVMDGVSRTLSVRPVTAGDAGELEIRRGGQPGLPDGPQRWGYLLDADALWVQGPSGAAMLSFPRRRRSQAELAGGLEARLPGVVVSVDVEPGDAVEAGQRLVTLESMKMEIAVEAPAAASVGDVLVAAGDHVERGQPLVSLAPDGDAAPGSGDDRSGAASGRDAGQEAVA